MGQPGAQPRVLLVDDEELIIESLSTVLRGRWEILTAASGQEAVDMLWDESNIQVVVSDLQMPGMQGDTFLAKAWALVPDATRILLTGQGTLETALTAVNEGHVFRILMKPCSPSAFRAAVEDGLEQYRLVTGDRLMLQERLEGLTGQLLRAEKMASLGSMAGAVGHELNNIATVLQGNLALVRFDLEAGRAPEEDAFRELDRVAAHLGTHASELQRLGKPGSSKTEDHDLRDIVSETVGMLRNVGYLKRATLKLAVPETPVPVRADRTRLEQVLINLVKNAADAVATNQGKPMEIDVEVFTDVPRGLAMASVQDNGVGIPKADLMRVFDPYFSRKNEEEGTGLGLPVCRQIMEAAHGHLSLESQEGEGTTFSFSLPLIRAETPMN